VPFHFVYTAIADKRLGMACGRYGLVSYCDSTYMCSGYCATKNETHEIEPELPVCPAFKEIGQRLGPFSLGMIPIGAYSPRKYFSSVHNAPIDAVRMFRDAVRYYFQVDGR
jgi:hypothetical protein